MKLTQSQLRQLINEIMQKPSLDEAMTMSKTMQVLSTIQDATNTLEKAMDILAPEMRDGDVIAVHNEVRGLHMQLVRLQALAKRRLA